MATRRKRTAEGSCWPCRRRRVLCDLTQPTCHHCASRQLNCEYAPVRLRWVDGVASRGKLARQNLPIAASSASVSSSSPPPPQSAPLPRSLLSLSFAPAATDDQPLLYFEHRILPRFNLATTPLEFDLTSLYHDKLLQRTATAVAKAHYAIEAKTTGLVSMKQSRLAALKTYREQLSGQEITPNAMRSLFLTNVFFCILDGVIEPSDETSAMLQHFKGGKAMLSNWSHLREMGKIRKGIEALAMSIYATMDLFSSLLNGNIPYFSDKWFLNRYNCDAWWGYLSHDDPFIELMAILTQLSHMGHHARNGTMSMGDLFKAQHSLERVAPRIDIITQPECNPNPSPGQDEYQRSWAAFCTAYQQTALIYMYRALANLEVSDEIVQQCVQRGISAICGKPLYGKLAFCLLFPSLVIGAHCIDQSQRDRLRRSLLTTGSYLCFGGIQMMDEFLQQLWKSNADGFYWWDAFRDIASKTSVF